MPGPSEQRRGSRWAVPAVGAGAAAVAVAVRLPHVYSLALSEDEVASARILREPSLGSMLGRVARTESTPPLWYALGWMGHQAGLSIDGVRLLSVASGALLAAAVVAMACRVLPLRFSAVAGLLVAVGSQFVFHGYELRAYELFALLAVLFALALGGAVREPGRRSDVYLAAAVAAGLLTHYFFVFTVAAGLCWLWLEPEARAVRRRATIAIGVGAGVCAPWLPYFVKQYRNNRFWWIGPFRLRETLGAPLRLFTPLVAHGLAGRLLPLAFLALVVAGAVALARTSATGRLCALLALGPLVFSSAAWAGGVRIFAVRNLIGIGPFVAVAAVGAVSLVPRRLGVVALAAGASAAAVAFAVTQSDPAPQYNLLARALVSEGWHPRDPVVVFGNFFDFRAPLEWYLPDQPVLAVSRPTTRRCGTVFVLMGRRREERMHGINRDTRVGGYFVARLNLDRSLEGSGLQRATILIDPSRTPTCLTVVHNRRLAPIV
jgi:Dolichyl-phosphate-mannose-protein mannosyltransferase